MKRRRWSRAGLVAVALGATIASVSVAAEPLVAELRYEASSQLDTCPSEVTFRAAVVERLKRDPFSTGAPRKIFVRLTQDSAGYSALVRVEEQSLPPTERRIEGQPSCAELGVGAALAVSIAIDPLLALGAPPEAPAAPVPSKPAETAKNESRTTPATSPRVARGEPGSRGVWLARVAPRITLGAVPGPSAGLACGAGYRASAWSLGLDAFTVLPQGEGSADSDRRVRASLWGATLGACLESSWLRGCALFASGVLFARGAGVDVPLSERSWHTSLGGSVGHSFRLGRVSLTPVLEGGARLHTSVLSLEGREIWATPRLMGSFGLELAYEL